MEKKLDNKTIIIITLLVVLVVIGGTMLYQSQRTETVSMNIGGQEFSATFEKQ